MAFGQINVNRVILEGYANRGYYGHFGDDASDKTKARSEFTLRVSRYAGKDDDGDTKYDASWFSVKSFGYTAADVQNVIASADDEGAETVRVMVQGELRQEQWETDDGQKRSKVVIIADDVRLCESLRNSKTLVGSSAGSSSNGSDSEPF